MDSQFDSLIEKLNGFNEELNQQYQKEDWESANKTLNKRASILEQMTLHTSTFTKQELGALEKIYQETKILDKQIIDIAESQKTDVANQLKNLKNAQKALPVYQANEK